jgi:hypothetical protein
MIIGYSILYVDDDTNIKDNFLTKQDIYSTWDETLKKACNKADEIQSKYGNDISYVSLFRADSKKICEKNKEVCVFRFIYKKSSIEFGNIYIVPVYDE